MGSNLERWDLVDSGVQRGMAVVLGSKERRHQERVLPCDSEAMPYGGGLEHCIALHVEGIGEEAGRGSGIEHMLTAVALPGLDIGVGQDACTALEELGGHLDGLIAVA